MFKMINREFDVDEDKYIVKAMLDDGRILPMSKKAQWSLLRLHHTAKIDKEVRGLDNDRFTEKFVQLIQPDSLRSDLRLIFNANKIWNVVTTKYDAVSTGKVYSMISKALEKQNLVLTERDRTLGHVVYVKKTPVLNIGLQFFAGDTITQEAIRISTFIDVLACLNPISFLGLEHSVLGKSAILNYKILRIEQKQNVERKIKEVVLASRSSVVQMGKVFEHTKKIKITNPQASMILATMGKPYKLGIKTLSASMQHFKDTSDKTVHGLSMATSYTAQHEDKIRSEKTRQALSVLSGALLLFPNRRKVFDTIHYGKRDKNIQQLSIDIS